MFGKEFACTLFQSANRITSREMTRWPSLIFLYQQSCCSGSVVWKYLNVNWKKETNKEKMYKYTSLDLTKFGCDVEDRWSEFPGFDSQFLQNSFFLSLCEIWQTKGGKKISQCVIWFRSSSCIYGLLSSQHGNHVLRFSSFQVLFIYDRHSVLMLIGQHNERT